MKTFYAIAAYLTAFVVLFGGFLYIVSLFGMYQIVDANGEEYSVMPYTTHTSAVAHAEQFCGKGCTVVRIERK